MNIRPAAMITPKRHTMKHKAVDHDMIKEEAKFVTRSEEEITRYTIPENWSAIDKCLHFLEPRAHELQRHVALSSLYYIWQESPDEFYTKVLPIIWRLCT